MIQGYKNEITPPRNISRELEYKPWIPDNKLTLTRVPNTQITCRLCRGSHLVVSKSMYGNYGDLLPCPNCDGSGVQMSDHLDSLWGRNR